MRLLLYSGGQTPRNEVLHDALSGLVGKKKRKSFTYIPSCYESDERYFMRSKRRYARFGFTSFHKLRADAENSAGTLEKALTSDVVYLAGGNTFYFLMHLRRSGLIPKLQRYVRDGGILAGLSAGGIILTPEITLAAYPHFDADANAVGLQDTRGMNLVPFEFFPHFESDARTQRALLKYSLQTHRTVVACADGGGVVVNGTDTELVGKVQVLRGGVEVG